MRSDVTHRARARAPGTVGGPPAVCDVPGSRCEPTVAVELGPELASVTSSGRAARGPRVECSHAAPPSQWRAELLEHSTFEHDYWKRLSLPRMAADASHDGCEAFSRLCDLDGYLLRPARP